MARRKGKSRRRIKGWQERYASDDQQVDKSARRQRLSPPGVKLPPRDLTVEAGGLDDLPRCEGMVAGLFPGGSLVRAGGREIQCSIAKTFRAPEGSSPLAIGDDVTVARVASHHTGQAAEADKDRADGMILSRGPRRTALSRPQPRSQKRRDEYASETFEKVVVANMDVLLIVAATCQPPLRRGLIDRYLIVAERGEMDSVLVINKVDLGPPDERVVADLRALDIDVRTCSALTGEGLDPLRSCLAGRRSVLAGASGVGKSTLVNALIPGAGAATGSIRAADERGRHTTSSVIIYDLPDGGLIVDTPGIRELGLALDVAELPWYFPEFEQPSRHCRFHNCTHSHEPDCAVRAAVDNGQVPARRYQSYLRLLETLETR